MSSSLEVFRGPLTPAWLSTELNSCELVLPLTDKGPLGRNAAFIKEPRFLLYIFILGAGDIVFSFMKAAANYLSWSQVYENTIIKQVYRS